MFDLSLRVVAFEGRAPVIGFAGGAIRRTASDRLPPTAAADPAVLNRVMNGSIFFCNRQGIPNAPGTGGYNPKHDFGHGVRVRPTR